MNCCSVIEEMIDYLIDRHKVIKNCHWNRERKDGIIKLSYSNAGGCPRNRMGKDFLNEVKEKSTDHMEKNGIIDDIKINFLRKNGRRYLGCKLPIKD